jgi:hypothetical protein
MSEPCERDRKLSLDASDVEVVSVGIPITAAQRGTAYDRLLRQIAIVRWTHLMLGAIVALTYESQRSFSHYAFWRSSGGGVITVLIVAIWPYALSYLATRRRSTIRWTRPWVFCFFQLAITLLVCRWYLSPLGRQLGLVGSFVITILQATAFICLAKWTFGDATEI